jgi:nitrogen fixation/metabolism regulation signal transduction histidine kinase
MTESTSDFVIQFDQAEVNTNHNLPSLMARLTHEMAQPMGAIESIAYYLRMVLPKEDQRTQRHLERIEELVACVNGTLSDAVQYLRQASSEPEEIDLHTLIADALAERPQDSAPVFHLRMQDGPAVIRMDASQGRHLIRSMFSLFRGLSNRCEAVHIRTSTEASMVTLEFTAVRLNATREEVVAMFEPFGKGFADGSGLALASVRRIFESNGGRISARSDNGRDLSVRGALPLAG